MPSILELIEMLAAGQKKGLMDGFKLDEWGTDVVARATVKQIAKAFGPDAEWDFADEKVKGEWTNHSMLTRILSEGFLEQVPFRNQESQVIQKFTLDQPIVGWVTSALNAWSLYKSGVDAATGAYLERVRNYTRSVSNPTTFDLSIIYRLANRQGLIFDDLENWPEPLKEQAKFLGYQPNLRQSLFEGLDIWPDINTILGWEFRNKAAFRSSSDLDSGFAQPPNWNETKYEGFKNRLVKAQGLPDWAWKIHAQAAENPLDINTAKAIYLRARLGTSKPPGVGPDDQFLSPLDKDKVWGEWYERVMYRNRFGTGDVAALRKLDWMIPPAQDLITMAVREVFSPAQAEALSLFKELPQEFVDWGLQQGLSEYWSKNYWGAHWQLPSPQMGFEMFHRNIIDQEELFALLKALDIAPVWRQKLTDIAYNVITRVDARRMHKLGVIDLVELEEVYGKQGYSPDDAVNMVDFTVKFNADEERDLTKGELLRIYKDGLIDKFAVVEGLEDLDYTSDAINMLIAKADYDLLITEKDLTKGEIKRLFMFEIISKTDAKGRLGEMGILDSAVNLLVRQWDEERSTSDEDDGATPKNLTRSEITKLLTLGIVDGQEWNDEMTKIGYTPKQVDWFNIQWLLTQEETDNA